MTEATIASRREARETKITTLAERMKKLNTEFTTAHPPVPPPAPDSPEERALAVSRVLREGGLGGYEDRVLNITELILGVKVPRIGAKQEFFAGLVLVPYEEVANHPANQPLFVRDGRYAWSSNGGGNDGLSQDPNRYRRPTDEEVEAACDLLHDVSTAELDNLLRRMPEAYIAKG